MLGVSAVFNGAALSAGLPGAFPGAHAPDVRSSKFFRKCLQKSSPGVLCVRPNSASRLQIPVQALATPLAVASTELHSTFCSAYPHPTMAGNSERLRQIEDLVHAARACDGDARADLLAGVDTDLRREVESLLAYQRTIPG